MQPDKPNLLNNIGVLLEKQGRHEEAIARYREALRLDPQHLISMRNIAQVLTNQGRYAEGLAAAQKVIVHYPGDAQAHHLIGGLLSKQGRKEEAIARYREALRLNPQHQTAMRNLALVLMQQERYAEGLAVAQKLITHYPGNAQGHHMVGFGLFHLNRKTEALHHYDRALALDPNLKTIREQRKQILESTTNEGRQ